MDVKGVVWLGTRTAHFDEMVTFTREILGLRPRLLKPDFAVFECPDGDLFEIFGPGDADHTFMSCPVGEFLVGDLEAARAAMEERGIEFIGPVHKAADGNSWSHFRAPDGHVYGITSHPSHPSHKRAGD